MVDVVGRGRTLKGAPGVLLAFADRGTGYSVLLSWLQNNEQWSTCDLVCMGWYFVVALVALVGVDV